MEKGDRYRRQGLEDTEREDGERRRGGRRREEKERGRQKKETESG
jgi:hypothetical protein